MCPIFETEMGQNVCQRRLGGHSIQGSNSLKLEVIKQALNFFLGQTLAGLHRQIGLNPSCLMSCIAKAKVVKDCALCLSKTFSLVLSFNLELMIFAAWVQCRKQTYTRSVKK